MYSHFKSHNHTFHAPNINKIIVDDMSVGKNDKVSVDHLPLDEMDRKEIK